MLEAALVTAVEIDDDAVDDLQANIQEFEIDNINVVRGDVLLLPRFMMPCFDTVIMNPPFGTKNNEGIDMDFLNVALELLNPGGAVYSFHKSSTRDYIIKRCHSNGYTATVISEMKFLIPKMYKIHKQQNVYVNVDFYRIARAAGTGAT